jgi:ATP-dependent exoDNAse (exonuclease V) beta subunit
MTGARGNVEAWVRVAAREHELAEHLDEAAADVVRALEVARSLGGAPQLEYPICMAADGGRLLVGFIDLVVERDGEVLVVDFKTDAPPPAGTSLAAYPEYERQLAMYVEALRAAGLVGSRKVRAGLAFTATGEVLWG